MFQNNLIAGAAGQQGGFYPYEIEQSLRFNDDDSARLTRAFPSIATNQLVTFSAWVKRGNIGSSQTLLSTDRSYVTSIDFLSSNALRIYTGDGSSLGSFNWTTAQLFRDTSAWYHVVAAWDTTQATATDRLKVYVNGQQISSWSVQETISSGMQLGFSSTTVCLGSSGTLQYLDGYMAEVNFIDGTALDPTSFGEFKSDIWVPKTYSGSYGTNGFYLPFSDGAAIGDDLSGNTNDWTANNLVSTDVLLDSPTNNWCSFNSVSGTGTLSEGNLRSASGAGTQPATFLVRSGKWYWEVKGDRYSAAICGPDGQDFAATISATGSKGLGWFQTGPIWWDGGTTSPSGTSYTTSDILGIALDMDVGTITFYKNNVFYTTLTFGSGTVPSFSDGVFPAINGGGVTTGVHNVNFGQDSSFAGAVTRQGNTDDNGQGDFYYTPPSGFLALNTANLPGPAIDPAVDDVPADYFNTVLYTGDGTSSRAITGVGFQPDWVWIKERNQTGWHRLSDAIRGPNALLFSNDTSAEDTTAGNFLSFDTDGFTVGSDGSINGNTDTYVAWNWLAGNGTASNTDGTITSTVSVNQKAGFSIVSYTAPASGNFSVGHGLNAPVAMVITKSRGASFGWWVWHKDFASQTDSYIGLHQTNAVASLSAIWGAGHTSLVTGGQAGAAGSEAASTSSIRYVFAEVEGFSKFGSYTGNGSTDGPFVYCGFRPAWVMVKRTDSGGRWNMYDANRDPENDANWNVLDASGSDSESTLSGSDDLDFLSNGFKARRNATNFNASGGTYIFMAFAEQPVKYSNAR